MDDNDADDLDDVDVEEDVSEHLGTEDLDEHTKENEATKVSFIVFKRLFCSLERFYSKFSL